MHIRTVIQQAQSYPIDPYDANAVLLQTQKKPIIFITLDYRLPVKMSAGWSLDFCLVCDQQTSGAGPYCSQSCRLADLDQHGSESVHSSCSPYWPSKSTLQQPKGSPASSAGQYHQEQTTSSRRQAASKRSSSYFTSVTSTDHSPSLTWTSSQTSLSSLVSTPSPSAALSTQVRHELQDYSKSFDQVRDWKRRLTNS